MTKYVLNDRKKSKWVVAALWLVYAASYFIRTCYSAAIISIVEEGFFNKGQVGLIGTAFFVCYGAGQLISGPLGDKINPFKMVVFGSMAGAVSCFAMAFADSLILMLIIWGANGFFQSMLWSPILRIFSETIDESMHKKAILNISLSFPTGTICAYLISAVIIRYSHWRYVFVCGSVCIFAASLLVLLLTLGIKNDIVKTEILIGKSDSEKSKTGFLPLAMLSGLFIIIIPSFIHGMMRDGIANWVPTMIGETYGVSASFSVFLTILLPICNAFGAYMGTPLYKKCGENEMKTAGITGIIALVPILMLLFIHKLPVYVTVILLALTTTIMYALNYLIISLVPVRFSKYSVTSSVSGILNAAAHLGGAISTYGFGAAADKFGWNTVIAIWIVSSLLTSAFSIQSDKKWKKFIKQCEDKQCF